MKKTILISILITLSACAKPYYGYSKQEWNALSIPQRQAVIKEYQPIIDAKRAQQYHDDIARQKETLIDLGMKKAGR